MVCAMVVEDILCVVRRPLLRVQSYVRRRTRSTVGQEDVHNPPFLVHGEDDLQTAGGHARLRAGELRSVAKLAEVSGLPVRGKGGLESSREGDLAVRCRAQARESAFGGGHKPLSLHVGLLHWFGQLHEVPPGAIVLIATVHATLALLPGRERLRPKLDA